MKKFAKFLAVIAAIALMTGTLTSCKEAKLTGVVLSDERIDNAVPQTTEAGTTLTYKTYAIGGNLMSNGDVEEKTPVTLSLKAEAPHSKKSINVSDFNIGDPVISVETRKVGGGSTENWETVIKVTHGNFSEELKNPLQKGQYTVEKFSAYLKFHEFTGIKIGTPEIMDIDADNKLYKNTITSKFGGVDVVQNLEWTLTKPSGPGEGIKSTRMLRGDTEVTEEDDNYVIYDSWMELEHTLQNGQTRIEVVWAKGLQGGLQNSDDFGFVFMPNAEIGNSTVVDGAVTEEIISQSSSMVSATKFNKKFDISFENGIAFPLSYWDSKAVYTNGVATLNFPVLSHSNFQHYPFLIEGEVYSDENGEYKNYMLTYTLTSLFGSNELYTKPYFVFYVRM